jgi:hypothetical protein
MTMKTSYMLIIAMFLCILAGCVSSTTEHDQFTTPEQTDNPTVDVQQSVNETDIQQSITINSEATLNTSDPSKTKGTSQTKISDETAPAEQKTVAPEPAKVEKKPYISISILGDPDTGTILEETELDWNKGDTVLDALKQVTRDHKIPMEYRGIGILAYVEGIGSLYEFDLGPGSGWLFKVNGEYSYKSAGAVKVDKGDSIEWIYTTDLGENQKEKE